MKRGGVVEDFYEKSIGRWLILYGSSRGKSTSNRDAKIEKMREKAGEVEDVCRADELKGSAEDYPEQRR